MTQPSLQLSNISKRFPGVQALNDVGLTCMPGEVHAILGENGSGKSTLLGIASGAISPDLGAIKILGHMLTTSSPALARSFGLAAVYQDNSLVSELSVAQNLFLGAASRSVSFASLRAWARGQLERNQLRLDPDALVATLSPPQRQLLEVAKALAANPEVLLLDEPTTALDRNDVELLHGIVRRIVADGASVVYVSHRLPEILALASRVTVLRDGVSQGTYDTAALSEGGLIALMVGRPIEAEFPEKPRGKSAQGATVLSVRNLAGDRFRQVSFELRRGEILGFAGAEGNGQREALRALAGFEIAAGEIATDGSALPLNAPRPAMSAGVMMLSGDRAGESIFATLGVRENITVQALDDFTAGGFVSARKERARTLELIDQLDITTVTLDQPVSSLSGGNQQKAVLGRSFMRGAKILLIEEPTQGVDAKARFDIYQALRRKAEQGTAFIIKSADATELAGLCDRVLVFSRGQIIRELKGEAVTEPNIVASFLASRTERRGRGEGTEGAKVRPNGFVFAVLSRMGGARDTWWAPLALLLVVIVLVGAYASTQSPAFLTALNFRHLLLAVAPLGLVSLAQLCVLLVGGFDMSVGSIMSLTVVIASFAIGQGVGLRGILAGALSCVAAGVFVGSVNGLMVRRLRINPVITTIATLSVLQGIALYLRPVPAGLIDAAFMHALKTRIGFIPYSSFGLLILAAAGDFWLYGTRSGLFLRSVGFREQSARRNGVPTDKVHLTAYVLSGALAAVGGVFLATEVGIGHPTVGADYTLTSIAAAVLGGASLSGGRGSFLGALQGAFFFALVINVIPFLGINTALGAIISGGLMLLAVLMYSGRLPVDRLGRYLRGRRVRPEVPL